MFGYLQLQSFPTPELFVKFTTSIMAAQQVYSSTDVGPSITPDDPTKPAIYYCEDPANRFIWGWNIGLAAWQILWTSNIIVGTSQDPNVDGIMPNETSQPAIYYNGQLPADYEDIPWQWNIASSLWVPALTYRSLVFTLDQTGTAAPNKFELSNQFPVDAFTATRVGVGQYLITGTNGTFATGRTFLIYGNALTNSTGTAVMPAVSLLDDNNIKVETVLDGQLSGFPIEVRVYFA